MSLGTIWGVTVIVLALVCWGGQCLAWLAPERAVALGLADAEANVEPVFLADGRGEAIWDTLVLWPMIVAGVLLVVDSAAWPHVGLVAGGMYLYFAGRGVSTRLVMQRRGFRIGDPQAVRTALAALTIWGAMSVVTIVAAVVSLGGS